MTEPLLICSQRTVLRDLVELAEETAQAETAVEQNTKTRQGATETDFRRGQQQINARFEQEKSGWVGEFQAERERISGRFESEYSFIDTEYKEAREQAEQEFTTAKDQAKKEYQETCWTITTVFDAAKTTAENHFNDLQRNFAAGLHRLQTLQQEAKGVLKERRQQAVYSRVFVSRTRELEGVEPLAQMDEWITIANEQLALLHNLFIPRLFKGVRLIWLFVLLALLLAYPSWLLTEENVENWKVAAVTCGLATVVLGLALSAWFYLIARGQVSRAYQPLRQVLFDAENSRKRFLDQISGDYQRQVMSNKDRRDQELRQALKKYRKQRLEFKQRRSKAIREIEGKYPQLLVEIKKRRDDDLAQAEERYGRLWGDIKGRCDEDLRQGQLQHDHEVKERGLGYASSWQEISERWQGGMEEIREVVAAIEQESRRSFPSWTDPSWHDWTPPKDVPTVLRFGEYQVRMEDIPNGIPQDQRLKPVLPPSFTFPALLPFPDRCSMLFKASDAGRGVAVSALQALMMRLLTIIPPGKVRFTILDPVGLGENFAAFMHLADYDELLVTNRIWTEQQHIEHRLADLTAHMENVIQKYLRNQFKSIEDYNVHAGEVAEPFRILVVANFPVNFTIDAARRLVSIAASGTRCGVYTLVTVDSKQQLPQGFDLGELEQVSTILTWDGDRFVWKDPDFEKLPLRLDGPPDAEFATRILRIVGEEAKAAKRVEVPFEFIAPPSDKWWTGDTRPGINVPLGRAGATKRQILKLGQGTAQHVLIAGKTGSGKSTLMHALITNTALMYSPDEVELYLVDFKKGVEFKTYATHELPHARVVAIESEREFGLSVLQRLDNELKRRADRFRRFGAQDLSSCRQADPSTPLPRVLLIVDEFQEFFVEDDRIAQDAALVMDRLVRQGRAFGIHVLLGSQTLGGAYTLARSTIDQMAVRIALQCSEADAHMILSEDNSAARLLSRPGEAIYNDANGLVEGNNPFQVVWLDDDRREDYLQRVQEMARQRYPNVIREQIVFEGNKSANVAMNPLLNEALTAPSWPAGQRAFPAWLGEAIAIKDPTAAVFRPQTGSNLIIIGQDDEAALGMMMTAIVGLAAQHPPSQFVANGDGPTTSTARTPSARFFVLDGTPVDAVHAGVLGRLPSIVPHPVQVVGWRDSAGVIHELATEVERRQTVHEPDAPVLYLFVYGFQRFRDLRRQDDDFSFSRTAEEKPSPSKQFATILREGAGLGVHVVAWCDNYNNLLRTLDRQGMREFEIRVLFQMNAADSSNLIDTPQASKLGMHRALFYSEEQGKFEKFRPYGVPTDAWLAWVQKQLSSRVPTTNGVSAPQVVV